MASKSLGPLGQKRNLFNTVGKGDKPRTFSKQYMQNMESLFPTPRQVPGFVPTGKPGATRKVY